MRKKLSLFTYKIITLTFVLLLISSLSPVTEQLLAANVDLEELNKQITSLQSDNFGVSMQAQNALVQLGDIAVPELENLIIRNSDPWNRVKAINVLGRIGTTDAVEAMLLGIKDKDEIVRDACVSAVEKLDQQAKNVAVPHLIDLVVYDDFTTRSVAVDLLQRIEVSKSQIATSLLEYVQQDTTEAQCDLALSELARLGREAGNVIPDLLDMVDLDQLDHALRLLEVITTISGEPAKQARPFLIELLLSSDWDLRQEAIWGMRRLHLSGAEIVEPVLDLLESGETELAIDILAQLAITQPIAAETLFDLIEDQTNPYSLRSLAYKALKPLVSEMEYHLDRGLVAVDTDEGVFLSWRLLGTDVFDTGFNIYRDGLKINQQPITESTNYLDPKGNLASIYYVKPVVAGEELAASENAIVWEEQYLSIPLSIPKGGITPAGDRYNYEANDGSVGDLTGDGQYEIVLKWEPTNAKDNAHDGYTGNVYIDAYTLEGEQLWRIDLGPNIRAGAHYTQFMVYDLDGDGRAEIVMKTADGTIDGEGNVIGDPNADYRRSNGRILDGPEYLTVFDGLTGKALATIDYKPARGNVAAWGDNYGNRVDRFLAGIAYLDGVTPSVVMARGYYTRTVLVAYNWRDGKLEEVWTFDTDSDPALKSWEGQGNHQLSVADVDADGKDEIIYGAMTIDHDGTPLYNTRLGHGDALHVADHDPDRPGLEVFGVQESYPNYAGINLRDARTGEILWGIPTDYDVGRGVAANIDPTRRGSETWASRTKLMDLHGNEFSDSIPAINFLIWWDGDLVRELQSGSTITKYDWENDRIVTLLDPKDTAGNNGTKNTPTLVADILGDWREELIVRTKDNKELRIYTTTDLTEHRLYTLMHDRMYRVAIAWQNVAYNQPPHPSFYVGPDMEPQTFNPGLIKNILDQYAEEFEAN